MTLEDLIAELAAKSGKSAPGDSMVWVQGPDGGRYAVKGTTVVDGTNVLVRLADDPL